MYRTLSIHPWTQYRQLVDKTSPQDLFLYLPSILHTSLSPTKKLNQIFSGK